MNESTLGIGGCFCSLISQNALGDLDYVVTLLYFQRDFELHGDGTFFNVDELSSY
jgi:hypothetical protein